MTDHTAIERFDPLPPGLLVPDGVARLDTANWGIIRAEGADATRFLHSQLTQDFALLQAGQARLAAFCNAKGRMQASFVAFCIGQQDHSATYLLVCRRDLLADVLKRLRMFVLRSKVTLQDASADYALYGLLGSAVVQAWGGIPPSPWLCQVAVQGQGMRALVSTYPAVLGDAQVVRAWCIQDKGMPAPAGPPASGADWELAETSSGIAQVQQATWEAFVPQMLNYESVEGVNFRKGCYPGQEVVARSQFRGAIKRRAFLAECPLRAGEVLPQAGQEVWQLPAPGTDEAPESCGVVAQVATIEHGALLLVSLLTAAADRAVAGGCRLHAVSATGPEIRLLPLPYALREDI